MIIFLVLIMVLIILLGGFGYLSKNDEYKRQKQIDQQPDSGNSAAALLGLEPSSKQFSISSKYYNQENTWEEMKLGSASSNEFCYDTSMCSSGNCYENMITNQKACFDDESHATDQGFTHRINTGENTDYGVKKLFTARCAQKSSVGAYETYYPKIENIPTEQPRTDALYHRIISDSLYGDCYDVDQLYGSTVVEICKAQKHTNNVCINDDGDRVYYPNFNTIRIHQEKTMCESNSSINYITLNFSNIPQTLKYFNANLDFERNQIFCLSVTSCEYFPRIKIEFQNGSYYLSFEGSWGFVYKYEIDKALPPRTIDTTSLSEIEFNEGQKYDQDNLKRNLKFDFDYGISYKFPVIKNITTQTYEIYSEANELIKKVNIGDFVDVSSLDKTFLPNANIGLEPCAMFDTSYKDSINFNSLTSPVDKQRFKVTRFSLGSDGKLTPDPSGLISSIVYRQLNYSKGGLYLDYYATPTTDNLTLRPMTTHDKYNDSKRWLLMKPLDISPYTLPTSSDAWCNFSYDISTDGGTNFNDKTGFSVPMKHNKVTKGQTIIDPLYQDIRDQPNNALFNAVGSVVLGGVVLATENAINEAKETINRVSTAARHTIAAVEIVAEAGIAIGEGDRVGDALENAGGEILDEAEEVAADEAEELQDDISNIQNAPATIKNSATEIYTMTTSGKTMFNWQNGDPSFVYCAQICNHPMKSIPPVKAEALNTGNLGSNPPGFTVNATSSFAKGDVLFSIDLHTVPTCELYKIYNPASDTVSPRISSRKVGDIFTDGEVDFIVKNSYEDTYFFDRDYFRVDTDLSVSAVYPERASYGTTPLQTNVINKIYQKNPQVFSRTKFTNNNDSLNKCTCDEGDNNMTGSSPDGCDISKNDDDTCTNKLEDVVTALNNDTYKLQAFTDSPEIKIIMKDFYNTTHSNNKAITLEAAYIKSIKSIRDNINPSTGTITIDAALYEKLGNDDNTTTSSIVKKDNSSLYDTSGKELSLDLGYSNFVRIYKLYSGDNPIAIVRPSLDSDGLIKNSSDFVILSIDYEAYNNNTSENTFTLREHHIMRYFLNDFAVILDHEVPMTHHARVSLVKTSGDWKIDKRAPRDLKGIETNDIRFVNTGDPISLIKNSILKHGPSPQQIAYLGSFNDSEVACENKDTKDDCVSDVYCTWRGDETDGTCKGKTLLEKFQENGIPLTNSQNLSGNLFNQKIMDSKNTALDYIKTLQIDDLNYYHYEEGNVDRIYGANPTYYLQRKDFQPYQKKIELTNKTPKLGRFIPYSYFYPSYRDEDGDEQSFLRTSVDETDDINTFYNNNNYTQFIPYGKKSDYQYGFLNTSDIPSF